MRENELLEKLKTQKFNDEFLETTTSVEQVKKFLHVSYIAVLQGNLEARIFNQISACCRRKCS